MRTSLRSLVVLVVVVVMQREALAIERNCAAGMTWNPSAGACVKKRAARKASPEELFYQAIDQLEGKVKGASAAKGVALLGQACTQKLAPACTVLGFVYLNGRGTAADPKKALTYYGQGCDLGDDDGCIGAADVYSRGLLGQVDHASAIPLLAKACDRGSGKACVQLADKYAGALGTKQDDAKAAELYKKAYNALITQCPGDSTSCYQLGNLLADGKGTDKDAGAAFKAYDAGCDAGSGDACWELARAYYNGTGTTQDQPKAIQVLGRACMQYDNATACHEVVVTGEDVKGAMSADDMLAMAKRACELDVRQCDAIGHLYGMGQIVAEDQDAAARYFEQSCEAGNATACSSMGYRAMTGTGIPKDNELAMKYWDRSCQGDYGEGCLAAGKAYDGGEIVTADHSRAFEYFRLGCLRSSGESCAWAGDLLAGGTDGTGYKKPGEALDYYDEACKQSWWAACALAGDFYRDGTGVHADAKKAIDFYTTGCEGQGGELSAAACESLGKMKYLGEGGDKDLGLSLVAFARACQNGRGRTCYFLDQIAHEGMYGEDAKKIVKDTLEQSCTAKEPVEDACVALSELLRTGGYAVAKDTRRGFQIIDDSCKRGADAACLAVADAYASGTGTRADSGKAKEMYGGLCDKGVSSACVQLGSLYAKEGKGNQAVTLYQKACDDGDGQGCNDVGYAHYTGSGTRWDVQAAANGYMKACELGDATGCSNVGELYEHGIAYAKLPEKAYEFYQKGCTPSDDIGCGRLARYYQTGTAGAKKDAEAAMRAFHRGCDGSYSDPEACRGLAEMWEAQHKGEPAQIAQLKQRAFDRARELSADNPYYKYVLGTYYRDGMATVKDPKKATELFVASCDGYDPLGCLAAGRLFLGVDAGGAIDKDKAGVELDRACAAQVKEACDLANGARGKGTVPLAGGAARAGSGGCCDTGDAGASVLPILFVLVALRRRAGAVG